MSVVSLVQGDCLREFFNIDSNSVDALITDPPYGIDFQSCRTEKASRKSKIANDKAPFVWFLPQAYRVLKPDGCILVFCRWDVQDAFKTAMQWAGFKVKSSIVWDREVHGMGDTKSAFAPMHDTILFGTKGFYAFPGNRPKDVLRFPRVPPIHLQHPNEKPLELMEALITTTTRPGDIVCDPFMGSGTTGVACARLGRKFIGLELDAQYFQISKERIGAVQANNAIMA